MPAARTKPRRNAHASPAKRTKARRGRATATLVKPVEPRPPNASCSYCKFEFYNQLYAESSSIAVGTICPRCRNGLMLRKLNGEERFDICPRCKGEKHPNSIYDMPFEVKANADFCLRCGIISHLEQKYPETMGRRTARVDAMLELQQRAAAGKREDDPALDSKSEPDAAPEPPQEH